MPSSFAQHNEVGGLKRALVKRPQEALQTQYLIDTNWKKSGWVDAPEFNAIVEEHFRLIRFLQAQGVTINYHDDDWIISLDSVSVRDTCVMTPAGMIQGCLHAVCRIPEPESVCKYMDQLGASSLGAIEAPGQLSGSDVVWINKNLVFVAESASTNASGIGQLRKLFSECDKLKSVQVVQVSLLPSPGDGDTTAAVRNCLRNAVSPLRGDAVLIAKHKFAPEDLTKMETELKLVLEPVTEEEYNAFGASVIIVNKFAGCMPDSDKLQRIKEVLETKYKYKMYPMQYEHLGRSGMGMSSLYVPLCRDEM